MTASGDSKRPSGEGERSPRRRPRSAAAAEELGVLSSLPSARPQRPSARRAAARRTRESTQRRTKGSATSERHDRIPPAQAEPAIPRQGFEAESEIEPGVPVTPPSGPDLAVAVAELVGDLAQTGLARGGRLLKDALGRLPGV